MTILILILAVTFVLSYWSTMLTFSIRDLTKHNIEIQNENQQLFDANRECKKSIERQEREIIVLKQSLKSYQNQKPEQEAKPMGLNDLRKQVEKQNEI